MTTTKIITDELTYWFKALPLWAARSEFPGQTKSQVLGLILRRQYRLHWLRG
jgi:hypothetical protein